MIFRYTGNVLGFQPSAKPKRTSTTQWISLANLYSVYILQCTTEKTNRITLHVGIAKDVSKRLKDHQNNKVKQTRGKQTILINHSEPMEHGEALRLEYWLKKQNPETKRKYFENKT